MPPSCRRVVSQAASTEAQSVTSQNTELSASPAPSSSTSALARGSSWSQIATLAPEASRRSTTARPMPWAPPVTTARRPARSIWFMGGVSSPVGSALVAGNGRKAARNRGAIQAHRRATGHPGSRPSGGWLP